MRALLLAVVLNFPYAFYSLPVMAEDPEEPVSIAVQGQGIDTVVKVPADRAGKGPHVKRKDDAKTDDSPPENQRIRGSAFGEIQYGSEGRQIGNVRVKVPPANRQ